MFSHVAEAQYPISFRKQDATHLGKLLSRRDSVDLIGMRRVGISNFLRFFLFHPQITTTYLSDKTKHLFIPIDLNDLIERELYPFWMLTLKRIVDTTNESNLRSEAKREIDSLFISSMQQTDLFFLTDSIRRALVLISEEGIAPTIFFLRFDRIKEVINPGFFDNLQGLKDATNQQLAYVFTSFRSIEELSPKVFPKVDAVGFFQKMYVAPAIAEDAKILFATQHKRYAFAVADAVTTELIRLAGGSAQYLQLSFVVLYEKTIPQNLSELAGMLVQDERIQLHTEELWESLTTGEKAVLQKVIVGKGITPDDRKTAIYLWETGLLTSKDEIFSPLFPQSLKVGKRGRRVEETIHFSKKEHKLYTYLHAHIGTICERDEIIETVWPEYSEFGISDWAIDRLVARVRVKLKQQDSPYEIKTIRTRGYQMIERS
jgi:hypothetical protein